LSTANTGASALSLFSFSQLKMALGLRKYGQIFGILIGALLLLVCLAVVLWAIYKWKNTKRQDSNPKLEKIE
jgi:tellurite resistance protein TehA-like permease